MALDPTPPEDDGTRWYHRVNACDIARVRVLAPVGDAIAWLWQAFTAGTECPCCLGTRLLAALLIAGGIGALL